MAMYSESLSKMFMNWLGMQFQNKRFWVIALLDVKKLKLISKVPLCYQDFELEYN